MKITEKDVKQNWDNIWQGHFNSKTAGFFEKIYYTIFKAQFSSLSILKELDKIIKEQDLKDFSIIECGCGSGYIQKRLYQKHQPETYFLDISKKALDYTKKNLSNLRDVSKIHFLEMSALNMKDIKDNSYDIVWNAGVIEHFNKKDQKKMVSEMIRITKKGGVTIFFTPSTNGKLYLRMKKRAERLGIWQAGFEAPVETLHHLIPKKFEKKYQEFSKGYISQLHYLKYSFKSRPSRHLASFFLELLQRLLFFLENKPGYFLITIIRKERG